MSLPFQGEQLVVFVTNDRNVTFKLNSEFWKMCTVFHELGSFPKYKTFSDDVGGNINTCYFCIVKLDVSIFRIFTYFREPIFLKRPLCCKNPTWLRHSFKTQNGHWILI